MKHEGVIEDYAVAGAMAILFWTEPVPTYDLDVLVLLPASPGPMRQFTLPGGSTPAAPTSEGLDGRRANEPA